MNSRLKKLAGTTVFVLGTTCFYVFVITVAMVRLPGTSLGTQLLFYFVCTIIWFLFAALLIRWMQKPARSRGP